MKNILYIPLLACLLSACNGNQENHSEATSLDTTAIIQQFYTDQTQKNDFSKYRQAIIINERGLCLNCNNAFSLCNAKDLDNDSTLFIISSDGTQIDISPYLSTQHPNVIWDSLYSFDSLLPMNQCSIITIK